MIANTNPAALWRTLIGLTLSASARSDLLNIVVSPFSWLATATYIQLTSLVCDFFN
jgi:hypothetical protein